MKGEERDENSALSKSAKERSIGHLIINSKGADQYSFPWLLVRRMKDPIERFFGTRLYWLFCCFEHCPRKIRGPRVHVL